MNAVGRFSWRAVLVVTLITFFAAIFAALYARSAIKDGALTEQIYGCIEERHMMKPDSIADRALVKGIQRYYAPEGGGPGANHVRGAIAYVGVRILYSKEQRRDLIWGTMKSTPLCPPRG